MYTGEKYTISLSRFKGQFPVRSKLAISGSSAGFADNFCGIPNKGTFERELRRLMPAEDQVLGFWMRNGQERYWDEGGH